MTPRTDKSFVSEDIARSEDDVPARLLNRCLDGELVFGFCRYQELGIEAYRSGFAGRDLENADGRGQVDESSKGSSVSRTLDVDMLAGHTIMIHHLVRVGFMNISEAEILYQWLAKTAFECRIPDKLLEELDKIPRHRCRRFIIYRVQGHSWLIIPSAVGNA